MIDASACTLNTGTDCDVATQPRATSPRGTAQPQGHWGAHRVSPGARGAVSQMACDQQ